MSFCQPSPSNLFQMKISRSITWDTGKKKWTGLGGWWSKDVKYELWVAIAVGSFFQLQGTMALGKGVEKFNEGGFRMLFTIPNNPANGQVNASSFNTPGLINLVGDIVGGLVTSLI